MAKVIFLPFRQCQQYIIETYLKEGQVHHTVPQEEHTIHKDSIAMAEPIMVNPNSYERVKEVLEHIKKLVIGPSRKWTVVGSDGVPYVLGQKLRDDNAALQDLLLVPGPGHFELNTVRAIFKLIWPVGLRKLAVLLGFTSEKALLYCQKAADHHKSWEMLLIFYRVTVKLLLDAYVQECRSQGHASSVNHFQTWIANVPNHLFRYLYQINFRFVLGTLMFRQGIRNQNSSLALCGRVSMGHVYYCTNMTTYMEIQYRDIITRVKAPPSVRTMMQENESFTHTGTPNKSEGGDFVLENRNRRSKMFIPPGVPTKDQWLRTCRLLDQLEQVGMHMHINACNSLCCCR